MKLPRALAAVLVCASAALFPAFAWQSDNLDGTFTNPVLYADYPDPDITRVGDDFYMVSTTFVNSPGIKILRSQDLVNWELVGHVASILDGGGAYDLTGGTAYRAGMWASSLRHRNGTFYVAVQPGFSAGRIYYATDPAGPWSHHQLDRGIYDPGLFIDDDGTGYIVCGHGPQSVLRLNADYSAVVAQTDDVIDSGGEGSHLVKRNGYYYLFNANPGVWPFQLRCSRATSIYGPWETGRVVLDALTGGHQGAIIDAPDGGWWGFVHRDSGAVGRMPQVGPVFWENDWPVFGTPDARDQIPLVSTKPVQGQPVRQPATSDEFSAPTLGLQWNWNHNPDNTRWSLTERPGYLRLRPTQAGSFWFARNTLTQKGQGPWSRGEVRLELSGLQAGDIAGFGALGKHNGHITVTRNADGSLSLAMNVVTVTHVETFTEQVDTRVAGLPFGNPVLYLRTDLDMPRARGACAYSTDGVNWTNLGGEFPIAYTLDSTFQGTQFALFCHNPGTGSSAGHVDIDWFRFTGMHIPNGTYRLVARHSGKAIDAYNFGTANGSPLVQWPYWGGPNQQWLVTCVGIGEYSIIGLHSGKSLDVDGWGVADGSTLQLWNYAGGSNQTFTLTPTDGGYHRISPVHAPGLCLDVAGISTDDGARIHLWSYWGGANQQWSFQAP